MNTGFIGAGKMAEAMIGALVRSASAARGQILVSDVDPARIERLASLYGTQGFRDNRHVAANCRVLVLAVKPQQLDAVLAEIAPAVTTEHLVISIAAGKRIATFEAALPGARVVRVMPNVASLVAEGMSVFTLGLHATEDDRRTAADLLQTFGRVLELPEAQFDAVTALSGSGPAFFALFLQELANAAVGEGLKPDDALLLAEQTMLGTARLLLDRRQTPDELITSVTSARGTTAAGLEVLRAPAFSRLLKETIAAAARRSRELSRISS